ncbi:MAG: response regulator, partial [Microcystaceae cyanobacterium]
IGIGLQAGWLSQQQQKQAEHVAHKLAGTLGIFGLTKGMQVARHLENLFSSTDSLKPQHAPLMEALVTVLWQEIHDTVSIQLSHLLPGHSPLLLILDRDSNFTQPLVSVAVSRGIRTVIASTIDAEGDHVPPDAIVLRLSSVQSSFEATDSLELLQTLTQHYPTLPILVVGSRDELIDRLKVVRRGGKFLSEQSTPEQIIAFVTKLLSRSASEVKVMVVDDDRDWLRILPKLLKPWGFQVTTLAEPQQFWMVLQTVDPDVLVLDVDMPQINGFELCQVLRNDPHWQRLPVLFLSVLSDLKIQNQAFSVGADDYLCKPVMAVELANRILNRLQRVRSWES